MMARRMRIGIDVGGTKIEGLALAADGRELARHRVATPRRYTTRCCGRSPAWSRELDERGVARPGSASVGRRHAGRPAARSRGVMLQLQPACLNDRPLDRDLAAALGRPVRLANDGKCFVLSEAVDGAAAPPADLDRSRPDVVFGATLGTASAAASSSTGACSRAKTAPPPSGATRRCRSCARANTPLTSCVCGHADCIESFTSGRGLAGAYRELGGDDVDGTRDRPPRRRRRRAGRRRRSRAYEDALARALAMRHQHARPARDRAGRRRLEQRPHLHQRARLWERYTVPKDLRTKLVRAAHGDASGVRGAALLWPAGRLLVRARDGRRGRRGAAP